MVRWHLQLVGLVAAWALSAWSGPSCSFCWFGSTSAFPGSITFLKSAVTLTHVGHLAALCTRLLCPPCCHSFQPNPNPESWLISTSPLRVCESFSLPSKSQKNHRGACVRSWTRLSCLPAPSSPVSCDAVIGYSLSGAGAGWSQRPSPFSVLNLLVPFIFGFSLSYVILSLLVENNIRDVRAQMSEPPNFSPFPIIFWSVFFFFLTLPLCPAPNSPLSVAVNNSYTIPSVWGGGF